MKLRGVILNPVNHLLHLLLALEVLLDNVWHRSVITVIVIILEFAGGRVELVSSVVRWITSSVTVLKIHPLLLALSFPHLL
jgi:hypothetical protein